VIQPESHPNNEPGVRPGEHPPAGADRAAEIPSAAETPRPIGEQRHDEPRSRGSALLAPLRWLRRKLSDLVRWVAERLRAPLRPIARRLMLPWVAKHLPAPLRRLACLLAPGRERGFGFWWLVATVGVAIALGMVVALLLTPVAGLIALLVVAIWALVRRRRRKQRLGTPGRIATEPPVAA
jgi:hypothetical protein